MTPCPPFEDLSTYVDAGLGREEDCTVQLHLASCPACQHQVQILSSLKETVARSAEFQPLPSTLRMSLRACLRPTGWFGVRRPRAWHAALAAGLIVAVVGVMGWWSQPEQQLGYEEIAQLLVAHHLHYLYTPDALEMASADPGTLSAWFHGRLPFPVPLPQPSQGRLIGGRLCPMPEHQAAVAFFEHKGKRLSLFTIAGDVIGPEDRQRLQAATQQRPLCLRTFAQSPLCLVCTGDVIRAVVIQGSDMEAVAVELLHSIGKEISNAFLNTGWEPKNRTVS
jgi:anti-sigma factor RsiW